MTFRKKLLRKKIIAVLILISTYILLAVTTYISDSLVGVFCAFALAAPIYISIRLLKPDRIVVWLRRFHQHDKKRFKFQSLIHDSTLFFAFTPITLQDSTFRASFTSGFFNFYLRIIIFQAIYLSILAFVIVELDLPEVKALTLMLLSIVVIFFALCVYFKKQGGVDKVESEKNIQGMEQTFKDIKKGKIIAGFFRVFSVSDDIWQQAVIVTLKNADIVVIDVTSLSDNLFWEIEQSFHLMNPQSIILVLGVEADKKAKELGKLRQKLQFVLKPEDISKSVVFCYPRFCSSPWFIERLSKNFRMLVKQFREKLIDAVPELPKS